MLRELLHRVDMMVILENKLEALVSPRPRSTCPARAVPFLGVSPAQSSRKGCWDCQCTIFSRPSADDNLQGKPPAGVPANAPS